MKILFVIGMLSSSVVHAGERIKGFIYDENGITFQVEDGCRKKSDFKIKIDEESSPMQLTLDSNARQICTLYRPYGKKVLFTWEELGFRGGPVRFEITNEISIQRFDGL